MSKHRRQKPISKPRIKKYPTHLLFYDTETFTKADENGIINFDFRIGVAIFIELDKHQKIKNQKTYRFDNIEQFPKIIEKHTNKKTQLHLYAHNSGFDVRVLKLPEQFASLEWENTPPIINNRVFMWKVQAPTGKLLFLDTANYAVSTVESLGKSMGRAKTSVDFNTDDIELLYEYCQNDVEILRDFMISYIKFIRENDLGPYSVTIASQSLNTFRYKFMYINIHIHNNEKAINLEREGYYGGRVEAYKIGKLYSEKYYYLDFNSMYPYIMKNKSVPIKLKGFSKDVPVNYLNARLSRSYCIANVTLNTKDNAYPIRWKNKLVFPTGIFTTTLHDVELRHALKHNHIQKIHKCAVYDSEVIFDKYVDFFYELKEKYSIEENLAWRFITKIFLNSLYGKFGQMHTERSLVGEDDFDGIWRLPCFNAEKGKSYQEINWYGKIYREIRDGETAISFPAIAGAITAESRHYLYTHIKLAGADNAFYCDTDSIIVNKSGYDNLSETLSETRLGALKIEHENTDVTIYGAKDYIFGDIKKKKGVPSKAKQLSENRWKYLQFQGFITWLNNGGVGSPTGVFREKTRKSQYNKGMVSDNGNVTPWVFPLS